MIETDRLIIRRFKESDAVSFYSNVHSDPYIFLYMDIECSQSLEETQKYIQERIQYENKPYFFDYCIELKENHEIIGEINASYKRKDHIADIGYIISSSYWNHGYGSEAVGGFIQYLFSLGIQTVIGASEIENIASQRVMEKNGMQRLLYVSDTFRNMEEKDHLIYFMKSKDSD